ncbi:MAG: hypothetical protein F6K11_10250 [Leptolyngbya sp. SIO3F4]|nr:hypothetical protein [Leptolyngbya sp. SIO3F4]
MSEAHNPKPKIEDFGPKTRTLAKVLIAALIRIATKGSDSEGLPPGFTRCQWQSGNRSVDVQVDTWGSMIRYLKSQSYIGYEKTSLPSESRLNKVFLPAITALEILKLVSIPNIRTIKDFGKSPEGIKFELINLPSWDKEDCAQEIENRYQAYLEEDSKNEGALEKEIREEETLTLSSVPQPFSTIIREAQTTKPPCYAPWPTAKKYVGREHTLELLHEQLESLLEGRALSVTAIGGEGKTELCRQYAHRYLDHYKGGVFWLSGNENVNPIKASEERDDLEKEQEQQRLRTKLAIANRIIDFAIDNGCPIEALTLAERYSEDLLMLKLKSVWGLWNRDSHLFIYDNLTSLDTDLLPPLDDPRFKVLLTTRINALGKLVIDFPLEPISDEAAVELLRAYVNEDRILREKSYADNLVTFAGKLPLGIELIGGYLDEPLNHLRSFEEVYKRLIEKRTDWSVIGDVIFNSPLSDEQQNISECYDISWTQLNSSEKEAAYLIASNTTHEEIDTDFLYAQIRDEEDPNYSDDSTNRTFNRLIKYNLIKHTVRERENYVSYHLLMRDFVRFQMPEEVREFLKNFWV